VAPLRNDRSHDLQEGEGQARIDAQLAAPGNGRASVVSSHESDCTISVRSFFALRSHRGGRLCWASLRSTSLTSRSARSDPELTVAVRKIWRVGPPESRCIDARQILHRTTRMPRLCARPVRWDSVLVKPSGCVPAEDDYVALLAYIERDSAAHRRLAADCGSRVRAKAPCRTCAEFGSAFLAIPGQAFQGRTPTAGIYCRSHRTMPRTSRCPDKKASRRSRRQGRGAFVCADERGRRALRVHLKGRSQTRVGNAAAAITEALN